MKISKQRMGTLRCAVRTAALRNDYSGRYQFFFFDKIMQAFGLRLNKETIKQAHIMIKEGRTVEEIGEFVLGDYEIPERTSPSKLNKVQFRLLKHIVHTCRRLLRQRDESWVDSFLTMRADFYAYAMVGGPVSSVDNTDTFIRMLKDGSTDEEIMKWYIGDFEVI